MKGDNRPPKCLPVQEKGGLDLGNGFWIWSQTCGWSFKFQTHPHELMAALLDMMGASSGVLLITDENLLCADPCCESDGASLWPCWQEDPVEALTPQGPDRLKATPEDADCTLARLEMLRLGVGEEGVDIGITLHHGHVIAGDECCDVGIGKLFAQGPDQRGCADQIADIVAADDQDAGLFFWSVQGIEIQHPSPHKRNRFFSVSYHEDSFRKE